MIDGVPISIALVAGGLAVLNPCGFPLLPAFLSFYLGADEQNLPRAPTRLLQGLAVGALVSIGFLGFFAAVGVPVSYGAAAIAGMVPWVGIATGALLALAGLFVLAGRRIPLPFHPHVDVPGARRPWTMLVFGVGYAAASLGCTLPIFLAVLGASLGAAKLSVFAAYAIGMTVVLMALSVAVALARGGVARALRPLLPYTNAIAGVLLIASGTYLVYYWARLRLGDSVTVADDPIVGPITRYTARIQTLAGAHGTMIVAVAAAIVGLALLSGLWRWSRDRQRRGAPRSLARE